MLKHFNFKQKIKLLEKDQNQLKEFLKMIVKIMNNWYPIRLRALWQKAILNMASLI